MWTSWFVLAVCAVITQSFPRPDEEYQIPDVTFGQRSQYYVLHDDGDFKYGYNTGDGAYESAVKMGSGDLTGFYGYNDAFGENVRLDYTAGAGGFVPRSSLLPVAPQVDVAAVRSAGSGLTARGALGVISESAAPSRSFEEAAIRSTNNLDGSYSFSYDNFDSSRSESADSSNNVEGQYSFVAEDGKNRQIRYRAGSGTGYVAEGDSIPVAPDAPTGSDGSSVATKTFSASQPSVPSVQTYSAGSVIPGDINFQSDSGNDASYSFSYTNPDSSRSESADRDLNVRGDYSFVADDGIERQVRYRAGSGTGFVAEGSHLPVAPEVPSLSAPTTYSAPVHTILRSAPTSPLLSHEEATILSGASAGGGYAFSYTNLDSSRSESADANNNVVGKYSFVADDGVNREIRYKAGSATGYVADGDSLPVAPEAPAAAATAPASVPNAPSQAGLSTLYSAPSPTTSQQNSIITSGSSGGVSFTGRGVPGDITIGSDSGIDGSYSFSYTNPDSSRSESADSDLNVIGDYSFVADDGVKRQVRYRAGSGTGFVAEGAHLPVPVSDTSSGATSGNAANQKTYSAGSVTGTGQTSDSISGSSGVATFRERGVPGDIIIGSDSGIDGSYSFSYTNPDSSRSESADSDLNVKGDYSFIADDGITRQVRYRAGSGTGFVAEGAHLPVPVLDTSSGATSGNAANQKTYSAGSVTGTGQTSGSTSGSSGVATFRGRGVPGDITIGSDSGIDGSYSFSYTNPDSSRSESADASNNVVGEYSFIADDGQNRQIRYRAGSGTGFVAEGDSIPVVPEISVVPEIPVVQQETSAAVRSGVHTSSGYTYQAPSVSFSAPSQAASTRSSSSSSSSPSSAGHLLGKVHVRQYPVERGRSKFGYVFTEV